MEIDWEILTQTVLAVTFLLGLVGFIYLSYNKSTSPVRYNADDLLVEDNGDVFQRGKYVYYSVNSDVLFVSPSAPKNGMHPIADSSAYYVGEL